MGTEQNNVITIDGFMATGRTTLANNLASTYGFRHLNLETVLRRLAEEARYNEIPLSQTDRILKLADALEDDELLSPQRPSALRSAEVTADARKLFVMPELPEVLNARFTQLAAVEPGLIAVGTSMGRGVFPNAPVQVFLTLLKNNEGPIMPDADVRLARLCRPYKNSDKHIQVAQDFRQVLNEVDIDMMRSAAEGWRLGPNRHSSSWKDAPVHEAKDIGPAKAYQQIFVNTRGISAARLKEMVGTLVKERMPHIRPTGERRVEDLTPA